jgi:hypothetical protein
MKAKVRFGLVGLMLVAIAAAVVGLGGESPALAGEISKPAAAAPDDVVREFYGWYLDYSGEGGDRRSPLADAAYRSSDDLTGACVARVDTVLTSFDKGGYDPFLLAQDVPTSIDVGVVEIFENVAHVPVETSFAGHAFLVTLIREDGAWKIDAVNPTPVSVVESFYGWYLHYSSGGEELRNPLVDGAYRTHPALAASFVREVAATIASFDKGGYDPILLAQDLPERITVAPGTLTAGKATVTAAMTWSGNATPTLRTVTLELLDGRWQITGVGFSE